MASDTLAREFTSLDKLRPRLTLSKIAASAISMGVMLVAVVTFGAGVLLLLTGGFFPMLIGVALIGVAFLGRPRFGRVPSDAFSPDELPHLQDLMARIAHAAGTRPPDVCRIDSDFNASVTEVGFRRTRVLTIGIPLFAMLTPQERVAILAHELGHFSNGDPRRGFLVHTALSTLFEWHDALVPRSLADVEAERMPGIVMLPVNLIMAALSTVPFGIAKLLVLLVRRDSQRAEYLADATASRIAGSTAAMSAFDKLHLGRVAVGVLSSSTDEHWRNRSLWDELQAKVTEFPERELERSRRLDRETAARLDDTHPPTTFRRDVIESRGAIEPLLIVSPTEARAVESELISHVPRIQEHILDAYQDSLRSWDTAVRQDYE